MCSRPFETRSLPRSLAATDRDFVFYVAFPKPPFDLSVFPSMSSTARRLHSLAASLATLPSMSLFPFASLLGLQKRAKVGLWDTTEAETTLRNVPNAGRRMSASRSPRRSNKGRNNALRSQFLIAHPPLPTALADQRNCDRTAGASDALLR